MKTDEARRKPVDYGDWAITIILLFIMSGAFILAYDWPDKAAFFPRLLSGVGAAFTAIRLLVLTRETLTRGFVDVSPPAPTAKLSSPDNGNNSTDVEEEKEIIIAGADSDEEGNEEELHMIFATAGLARWSAVVGWLTLFFAGLYFASLLVILPVFTALYLRKVAKSSWLFCGLYVLATAGVMYLLFVSLLHLPLPEGTIFTLG